MFEVIDYCTVACILRAKLPEDEKTVEMYTLQGR